VTGIAERCVQAFEAAAAAHRRAAPTLSAPLAEAAALLGETLARGGKLLVCGNGGSAAESQHFASELTGRFQRERRGLPVIALTVDTSALTAIANDYGFERVFARQVEALGRPGDVLVAISTSGRSANVVQAADAARAAGLAVVAVTGAEPGPLGDLATVTLAVPEPVTAHVQEVHLTLLHVLCDEIERALVQDS
jgi:D-sedoheptulose 7-phosphate isomerase